MGMFVNRSDVLGMISMDGLGNAGRRAYSRGLSGDPYGPASGGWASMLASGKLSPVLDNFMNWAACGGGGCAFDPSDPGTIYLTKVTPSGGTPPAGYRVGPKTSAVSWSGSGAPPWPGAAPPPAPAGSGLTITPTPYAVNQGGQPQNTSSYPSYAPPAAGAYASYAGSYVAPPSMSQGGMVSVPQAQSGISTTWLLIGLGGATLVGLALLKRSKKKAAAVAAPLAI